MRYYKIVVTNPTTNEIVDTWTSLYSDGTFNPGGLQAYFDIQRFDMSTPKGMSLVRVWGESIKKLQQAKANYTNMQIQVYLGMSAGLPLANASQAGLVLNGTIFQAFGNWQGTEQTLDFIITAGAGTRQTPVNLVMEWASGQKLESALFFTLQRAFPDYSITVNIDDRLVCNYANPGYYGTLTQLSQYMNQFSRSIITDSKYSGVRIAIHDKTITAYDSNTTTEANNGAVALEFNDLVGQPTWIDYATVQIKVAMRADIMVGTVITMPENLLVVTSAASYSAFKDSSAFSGNMLVNSVRCLGNNRARDAEGWVTILEATPQ